MTDQGQLLPEVAPLARALTGQYAFECEIGRGGMGIVYRARDLKLDRPVAIKVLPPYIEKDARVRERFLREARTAASLSHPNIVPIYRADEIDGHVFFAMAYVDGDSLGQRVRASGPLSPVEGLPLLAEVARALDYAHGRSVIHRDVKAENILIDRSTGRAFITDFGIARVAAAASMTATGQLLGTVWYMSPEQVMGQPIDGRSDFYALGVVGYYALSGHFPFEYEAPAAVLVAHATKPAPPLSAMAPALAGGITSVIDRCLAKDPAERYQTGEDFARALENAAHAPVNAAEKPAPLPMPAVLSETDANALWRRAAELQAETGRVARPLVLAALRAPPGLPGAPPTTGYRVGDVLGAASEAGIGDEFVARAAAELGLVSAPGAAPSIARSGQSVAMHDRTGIEVTSNAETALPSWRSRWRGAPGVLDYEVRLDGEATERDLEIAVELIRRTMKQVGVVSRIGRSLSWSSVGDDRKVDVTIVARSGHTVIRATERLGNLAGGLFGGIMGGMGGGGGSAAVAIGAGALHSVPLGFAMWLSVVAGSYALARGIYTSVARDRQTQLRRLVMDIADFVQDGGEHGLAQGGQGATTPGRVPPALVPGLRTPGVGR
jgi:eukaryotic-like serine/threonine-protein kinase